MDAAAAALIGAAVASGVSLASQVLGHELSLRRDRRGERRQRARETVATAAKALYLTRALSDAETAARGYPETLRPEDLALYRGTVPMLAATSSAMTELQIEFGYDHPLVETYFAAIGPCLDALSQWADAAPDLSASRFVQATLDEQRAVIEETIAAGKKLEEVIATASSARDNWVRQARATLDSM